jgi:hypothetical protein
MSRPSPISWPKTYRLDGRRWLARGWPGLAALTLPLAAAWAGPRLPDAAWAPFLTGAAVALAALGMIWLLRLALWRAVLEADAIRLRGLMGERRLARAAIAGVRRGRGREPALLLVTVPPRAMLVGVTPLADEPGFARWLDGVADLDLKAHEAKLTAALADPLLGEVADERQADIARQGRAGRWLLAIGLAVTAWAALRPEPYEAAVIAAGAVVPLLVMGAMVWRLQGRRWSLAGAGSWGLVSACVGPAAALAWRASADFDLVWPWTPLPWAIGAAVSAALIATAEMAPLRLRRRRQGRRGAEASLAPVAGVALAGALAAGCWTWGALIFDNAWGDETAGSDGGAVEYVTLGVTGVSPPGQAGPPRLSLLPWQALSTPQAARRLGLAGRPAEADVAVSPAVWTAARRGQAVCVALRPGARGWPILAYAVCPPKKPWLR